MEISINQQDDFFIVKLKGRLDTTTAPMLENKLIDRISKESAHFILDFKALEYISSAGLRIVLMAAKKIKGLGGIFYLTHLSKEVQQVFEISGFLNLIKHYPTNKEALNSVKKEG